MDRILVIRTDRIGDVLMNLPMLRRLRENNPRAYIALVCNESVEPLLRYCMDINRVVGIKTSELTKWQAKIGFIHWIRKERFDTVITTQSDKFYHLTSFLSGASKRVGFKRKWGGLLNASIPDTKTEGNRHEIDCNLELSNLVCKTPWSGKLDLGLDTHPLYKEIIHGFGLNEGKKHIAVHPYSSDPRKAWSPAQFRELIELFLMKPRYQVFIIGAAKDPLYEKALQFEGNESVVDLTGKTTLDELGVLLGAMKCVVSMDSGPYHIAWMQKIPTVGIFVKGAGGSNPVRWGAYKDYSESKDFFDTSENISPQSVYAAAEELVGSYTV